ncbi:hypothetical protein JCM6882_005868 [Rhodosporidiobolus microsporus]
MTTTLKSALRFPAHPPPPPTPPTQQYPVLTSRFSAETLVIKSPPRAAIQRIFSSSSHSPPGSPRRRSSSQGGFKLGHSATASESRINISSPTAIDTPGRPSLDDDGLSHSRHRRAGTPTRSHSRTRARTPSGTAADKLADAAHEVIAKLTLRRHGRQPSSGSERSMESLASPVMGRKSSESTRSERRRSRTSRSLSSPSPVPAEIVATAQPPSRRPPPRPTTPPFKLTDLPPRSDSRNACFAPPPQEAVAKPPTRRAPPPPLALPIPPRQPLQTLAASRPRPKHLPNAARPRPKAPPTPSVKPLRPARLPPPPPLPVHSGSVSTTTEPRPFHAFVTKGFAAAAVEEKGHDELFVKLDVGGESTYTTSVSTLLRADGAGGKLAEFVEGALRDAAAASAAVDAVDAVEDEAAAMQPGKPVLDLPIPVPLLDIDDDLDGASSISINASPFAASPCPQSPFPFAGYASDSPSASDEDKAFEDPMSPVDPFVVASSSRATNLFLALPPSFAPPPPALPSPPTKEVPQPKFAAHAMHLVPSPTHSSGGKHKSVHPDFGTVELPPSPPASLPSVPVSSSPPDPSAAELAARRALASRVQQAHLSRASTASSLSFSHDPTVDDDHDADDDSSAALLQPFFSVMRHQLHTNSPLSPSSPITAAAFSALERQSLDYGLLPSDVEVEGEYDSEEDRSRSTVLGVPRGMSGMGWAAAFERHLEEEEVPDVPSIEGWEEQPEKVEPKEEDGGSRGRTPSLTMSATTYSDYAEGDEPSDLPTSVPAIASPPAPITLSDCTLHLFLDRTDSPLASSLPPFSPSSTDTPPPSALTTYSSILTFLRTGSLPPALTLPRFSSSPAAAATTLVPKHPDVDPLVLSILRIAPAPLLALISGLRTLEEEARWLGMGPLKAACQAEIERVRSVVEWLSAPAASAGGGKKQGRSREASREEALQAKWI